MIKDFNKIAIIAGERNVCYSELILHVNEYAHRLREALSRAADGGKVKPITSQTSVTDIPKVLIFSENREEWAYALFGTWQTRSIFVPVDASSTVSDLEYIMRDCQPKAIWLSEGCRQVALDAMKAANISIEVLPIDVEKNHVDGIVTETWEPDPEAVSLIVYTSGTTGSPKGVMLTFNNIFANIRGVSEEVEIFNPSRRTMILLPLHHILPLMGTLIAPILRGGGVAVCPSMTGSDIMDTLCRGKISIFVGVPRLWQTLYSGIKKKIDEKWLTRTLFNICQKVGSRSLSRFVFQSLRKKMGGHIDYFVSGGAALDREIGNGFKTLGLDVLEGYGMTETAPIIAFTRPGDIKPGCVGLPLPSMECKIVNGELCAKGSNVMKGYYNRPEETAAVIDGDGFIHTGDLAEFDEDGRIIITGRSKEIIVLSNGKNVMPGEIEFQLERYDDYVKEVAVTEKNDMLLAIVVPQEGVAGNADLEQMIKEKVIQPYNKTVENYKKIMNIFIYNGELPRTKLDKIQRFKLKEILEGNAQTQDAKAVDDKAASTTEKLPEEYTIIRNYIEEEKKISVKPTDHIETDLAFDSLDKIGLQGFIEQTFGMTVNADTMAEFPSILALSEKVAKGHTRMEVEKIDWNKILRQELQDCNTDQLPTASCTLNIFEKIAKTFFTAYNRMTIKGVENIPAESPFILAPNHQSYLDALIAMAGVPNSQVKDIYFYATEEHVQGKVLRYLAAHHNIILMERRRLKDSILKLATVLRQGKSIMIFPEGTRTYTGETGEFKKTFAILSKELNVPIVPVRITGAFRMLKRGSRFIQPCHIQVEYLPKVVPNDSLTYEEIAEIVKTRIVGY